MSLPEWKDRRVERENTYNVLNNKDGTITLIPVTGEVYEPGTPLNALNLKKINSSLEQINNEVKKPITLNKCDSEMLGAIQNKQGETTFNLLSIPRDKSVTVEKTNFINNCLNLFDKKSSENLAGKTIRVADGVIVTGGVNDFVSHKIPIATGTKYILTFISSAYQNNILRGSIIYIVYNKELEKQSFGEINTTNSEDLVFTSDIDGYIVFKQSISNYDNLMFINATKFENEFVPVTNLVGKSYTVPKTYEEYKIEVENLKVGYLEEDVNNIKLEITDINKNFNDLDLGYNPAKTKYDYYKTDKTKANVINSSLTSSLIGKTYRAYENGIKKDTFTYSTRIEDMAIDANYLYQKDSLMYWVEFMFDGISFEIISYSNSANFVVIADDVVVTDKISVLSSGGLVYTGVTFNERKIRKIRICFRGGFRFYGIKTDITGTIFPFNEKRPFVVFDGDSITEGTGSNQGLIDGYVGVVSKILNWKPIDLAYGGTGFVNPGAGGRVPIGQRLDNVVSKNPDIFVVCCGLNDCGQEQYFNLTQQAIKDYFTNLKAKLKCEIIVLSPFSPNENGNVTNLQTVNNWVRENALLNNFPFIDTINGETYDKKGNKIAYGWGGLITGTGKVGATTGDGNRDIYITNDGTHPTSEGHIAKGYRVAEEIYRLYNN